jgi:hypothetical protein
MISYPYNKFMYTEQQNEEIYSAALNFTICSF